MIHVYGEPDAPFARLLGAVAARGHEIGAAREGGTHESSTLVLAGAAHLDPMALGVLLGGWRYARGARVLVLSRLGAHPDARARSLRALWELEEHVRATGMRSLTLRLAPLIGPESPLWLKLRSRPQLPKGGRGLIQPVAETDVVETLDRLFRQDGKWEGWFEVAGRETLSLAEMVELAAAAGPGRDGGAWEPPLEELAEHRLAEPEPWIERFGVEPRPVRTLVAAWPA